MKRRSPFALALALALALWFAPSARAQPVISTTAYTRGLLIQATAAACRAYLGITNNTGLIFFNTNNFIVTSTNVSLRDPLILTNVLLVGALQGLNWDTTVFDLYGGTNITLQGSASSLPLTNVALAGGTTVRRVALGSASGTLTVDPSLADEFSVSLTGDLTLGFTLASWQDGHNVRLRAAKTGNFSLTITNVAYWYPNGNSTQITNDWGAGIHNSFSFWKDDGEIFASDKEGIGTAAGGGGGGGTVLGSGSPGFVPYWSGPTTLADSPLRRVSATALGIGSATNLILRSGADLVYSNTAAATAFKVQNGTDTAAMGIDEGTGQPYFQGNNTGEAARPTYGFGGNSGYYHAPNIHLWAENGVQIARLYYNNTPFTGAGALSLGAGAIYFGGSPQNFTNSISSGQGSPEGVLMQPPGSFYLDRAGAAYLKATGTGNTGWSALGTASGGTVLGSGSPGFVPYWSGPATLADSPLQRVSATQISLNGTTNRLTTSGQFLVYENAGDQPGLKITNALGVATFGLNTGGNTFVDSTTGFIYFGGHLGTLSLIPQLFDTYSLGNNSTTGSYHDLFLANHVVWNGTTNTLFDTWGTGTPEGVIAARPGSTYRRADGGAGTSFYVKESGTGNTGWVGK